jgi:putative ABC transport system permease protein
MSWIRRLVNLLRADRLSREHDHEVAFHIDELTDELVAAGMREPAARREAVRRFGHRGLVKERLHDVDVLAWLDSLLGDLRQAARALRANAGLTLVAVLSLGLGIGANTAIFSLIDAVMLRALPVRHPETLVQVTMESEGRTFTNPLWEAIRDRQRALAGSFAYSDRTFNLATAGIVRRATGTWVSGGYFRVLGVGAALGRVLDQEDDRRGCPAVAVLSHGFWQREYGGARDVVGRTLTLDGHRFDIVGVAVPSFSGLTVGRAVDVFAPLCTEAIVKGTKSALDARSRWFLSIYGRLPPGVSLPQVRAGLAVTAPAVFEATVPTHWAADEQREYLEGMLSAEPAPTGESSVRERYGQALVVLLLVVGVVLLIACANVAQLLVARGTARQHEIAVRLAIGAGRGRLIRQLLTESILLSLLGAAAGVMFARWSSHILVAFLSTPTRAVWLNLSLDLRVLTFTISVAVLTGLLFGLAPAWRASRVDPQLAMRGTSRVIVGRPRHRFAGALIVAQVALSLVLVMVASLLVGSFRRLATLDPGFRRDGLLLADVDWANEPSAPDRDRGFPRRLLESVRAIPGVRSASASFMTPISGTFWNDYIAVDGFTPKTQRDALAWFNAVTDGYVSTLGMTLLAGRDISPLDGPGAPSVVVVNETLARRFFGTPTPIGRRLRINAHDSLGPPMEIVGVVADAKYGRLTEQTRPTAFVPLAQTDPWGPAIRLALRSGGSPGGLVPAVTAATRALGPSITLEFTTLDAELSASLALPRLLATLSGFFGGLALLLAIIGLYGTMSYTVARRRSEIGIRIALGAARARMLRMVAGEATRMVAGGVVIGAGLALLGGRAVAAFLYGVTPSDPVTLALSAVVLAAVATVAGLIPAWRAARIDPMTTLREE